MTGAKMIAGVGWADLHDEIWRLIIAKLPLDDFLRCSSVCKSFNSTVRDLKSCSAAPRNPWLMLPSPPTTTAGTSRTPPTAHNDRWNLRDPANNKVYTIPLPEIRNSTVVASSHGCLVLADHPTADLRLFSPFTRAQIPLPPTTSLPHVLAANRNPQGRITTYTVRLGINPAAQYTQRMNPKKLSESFFNTAVLGFLDSTKYTVVLSYGFVYLALARSGDKSWTPMETPDNDTPLTCTIFQGLIYVMYRSGMVASFNSCSKSGGVNLVPQQQVVPPANDLSPELYLVSVLESGELLQIYRNFEGDMVVFKLDREQGKWINVISFGGYSLFLASKNNHPHSAVSVKLPRHDLKGNCIYLAENGRLEVYDMNVESGIHNLSIQFSWNVNGDGRAEPLWISPILVELAAL